MENEESKEVIASSEDISESEKQAEEVQVEKTVSAPTEMEEVEITETQSEENNEPVIEKPKSMLRLFFEDLADRLSLIRSLFYTGVVCAVSIFGFIFFNILKGGFPDDISMTNSCLVLQVFFGIVAIIFVALFVASIVFNIIRRRK